MNCQQFENRFHDMLDRRECPADDLQLQDHAAGCRCCEDHLDAWSAVESTFESSLPRPFQLPGDPPVELALTSPSAVRFGPRVIVAIAAVLMALVGLWSLNQRWDAEKQPVSVALSSEAADSAGSQLNDRGSADKIIAADLSADEAVVWWQSVQDRDWVDETMPAVRRIQEGVAPIGRSLLKAVTILTGAGVSRPS